MPRALVVGCSSTSLTDGERRFLADADPLGVILFARNIAEPEQVRALIDDIRAVLGRADAPVLVDQEGGRVQRLSPPHWRAAPAPGRFGALAAKGTGTAVTAAQLNARLMAADLAELGITVACTPVLDLPAPDAHGVIGDRALAAEPGTAGELGAAVCTGLMRGGVLPVIKHLPGHGRARADSHAALPAVEAGADDLVAHDFVPFAHNADAPWGMTAHVRYTALDPAQPATTSARVIGATIRDRIGFGGMLVSDDLEMGALDGDLRDRAAAALAAGCDAVLACSGDPAAMARAAEGAAHLSNAAARRVADAETRRRAARDGGIEPAKARARLGALLGERI